MYVRNITKVRFIETSLRQSQCVHTSVRFFMFLVGVVHFFVPCFVKFVI